MAHDVVTVAEEWVYQTLAADGAVTTIFGVAPDARIWPAFAPQQAMLPYITHDLAGAPANPIPYGKAPPSQYVLIWYVTVWGDGQSRQALRGGVKAWLGALLGSNMGGTSDSFLSSDGVAWGVNASYYAPIPVPGGSEVGTEGVYQRVCHGIRLELRPLS